MKGEKFSIPPEKLNYIDYVVNFQLFYRIIYNLDSMSNKNFDFVKTKIKVAALTSFNNYNVNLPHNWPDEEFEALQNLTKNTNLVIQKPDKGISWVVLDKNGYIKHIELLLSDEVKFEEIDVQKGLLNFTVNHEKWITKCLKSLKSSGALKVKQHEKIKAVDSRPGTSYGICKLYCI